VSVRCGPPVDVDSEFIRHCFWCVAALVWFLGTISIADRGIHAELSAFLAIAWYTYRNKGALKFSALIRTIISEATIYFMVMIAVQTYIQISLSLMKVRSLSGPAPFRDR